MRMSEDFLTELVSWTTQCNKGPMASIWWYFGSLRGYLGQSFSILSIRVGSSWPGIWLKAPVEVGLGIIEGYRSSYGTDFDISEIAGPVVGN